MQKEQKEDEMHHDHRKQDNNGSCMCLPKHTTLHVDQVESIHQEPYILTGYRPANQPWRYYLLSAFWIHNETVNIWTHAIGCVLLLIHALILGEEMDHFRDSRAGLMIGFFLTCFLSNLFSSVAHLLHSKSAKHHYLLYFLDYAGICIYNFGNGISAMYTCSTADQFSAVKRFFLPVLVLLIYLSFLSILVIRLRFHGPKDDFKRKVVMTVVYLILMVFVAWPITARYVQCVQDQHCSVWSLNHITIVFVFFFLDGLSFSALVPERLRPGLFDIWGHSHQWFHILVMVTQQLQLHALRVDFIERDRGHHVTTGLSGLLLALLVVVVAQAVTVKLMVPSIEQKITMAARQSAVKSLLIPSPCESSSSEPPPHVSIQCHFVNGNSQDAGDVVSSND